MNHLDKEGRKQKRLEVLETNHPVCATCGEDNSVCFEQHHIAGKAHSDDLARLCLNCHRKVTDDQKDHPKCNGEPTQLQSIGFQHLGLADLLALAEINLRKSGHRLIETEKDDPNKGDHG